MQNEIRNLLDLDEEPEQDPDDLQLDLVETDSEDGLTAPMISDDPEHDRMIDPED
jgi:hypothetical protein